MKSDEYEEVFDDVEEEDEKIEDAKEETKKKGIDQIVHERNKIFHEKNAKFESFKDSISLNTLELFGDPDEPDYESKSDLLKKFLRRPILRKHPMSILIKEMLEKMEELQEKYEEMIKLEESFINRLGKDLDESIILNKALGKNKEETKINLETTKEKDVREREEAVISIFKQAQKENKRLSYRAIADILKTNYGYGLTFMSIKNILEKHGYIKLPANTKPR